MKKLAKGDPCIHCGKPFRTTESVFRWVQGWRVHPDCAQFIGEGHQLKGCLPCITKGHKL